MLDLYDGSGSCFSILKPIFMKKSLVGLVLLLLLVIAIQAESKVTQKSYIRMEVDARYDSLADVSTTKIMNQFKSRLDLVVTRPIGVSVAYMEAKAPESLLSNFLSDQLFEKSQEFCSEGVDMAVINMSGIRAPLPAGPLTVGDIYRIMPFENELVVVELRAADVLLLMQKMAKDGGEGVSNVRLTLSNGVLDSLMIGGKSLDMNRTYRIATMDYLADGNGGMPAFCNALKRTDTHLKVRDVYIRQIEKITAMGNKVIGSLDGRIRLNVNH
jgi:2',3'-cyclic-nucleotide 2'-phosphodiesterase (5'-nucleotidase family)